MPVMYVSIFRHESEMLWVHNTTSHPPIYLILYMYVIKIIQILAQRLAILTQIPHEFPQYFQANASTIS
jgi:hypothetical protein